MHPLLASAAEGAAESGETISPILAPYPGLMFWTIVAFFLTLWVLKKYAFGPIQEALDKRRAAVNGALERAEKLRADSEQMLAKYETQLATARAEADGILDRSRKAGDEMTVRMKTDIEQHRKEQMAQISGQITAEVEKAKGDLRSAIADMTVEATEKVLNGSLDMAQHEKLVEQAVNDLDFSRLEKVGASS